MTPDFDELVGTDLEPGERERLERVHELLIAAGPPPDLVDPRPKVVELAPRRRRGVLLALAAAIAVTAFALGAAVVEGPAGSVEFEQAMKGTPVAAHASGSLVVYKLDDAGNWPMRLRVEGLQPTPSERPFELWLTRGGKLEALCGSFLTSETAPRRCR